MEQSNLAKEQCNTLSSSSTAIVDDLEKQTAERAEGIRFRRFI